jgi:hypothetical protein
MELIQINEEILLDMFSIAAIQYFPAVEHEKYPEAAKSLVFLKSGDMVSVRNMTPAEILKKINGR